MDDQELVRVAELCHDLTAHAARGAVLGQRAARAADDGDGRKLALALADRLAGCLRALREAGVEQDPALVRCCAAAAVDGYTQTRLMMTMPDPPTAIVCCSEELCTGAVRACMDLSLVPGRDISLVSFDELITPLAPTAITSVFSPRRKMAKVAAERLLEMVANPAKRTPRKDVVETIIHEQHSIAQL